MTAPIDAVGPMRRMFFAVLPDAQTRARLAAAADSLQLAPAAKRLPSANYHLTIAFVGAIAAERISVLEEIGRAERCEPFTLRVDAYEYWPKPEVIVAVARTVPPELLRLWQRLHAALAQHGWALDAKRLRPHVTLMRKVSQAPLFKAMSAFDWVVHDLNLMSSDTSGEYSAYTVVDTWPLLDIDSGA